MTRKFIIPGIMNSFSNMFRIRQVFLGNIYKTVSETYHTVGKHKLNTEDQTDLKSLFSLLQKIFMNITKTNEKV